MCLHRNDHEPASDTGTITIGRLATILGAHPNTLRWYETAGYLPSVPRTPGGYRQYCPQLVRLARVVRESQPLLRMCGPIRRAALAYLKACREDCVARTRELQHKSCASEIPHADPLQCLDELGVLLCEERRLALDALKALDRFRHRQSIEYRGCGISEKETLHRGVLRYIGQIVARTGLTRDQIINWERDGLCHYPRSPAGYRLFGVEEVDRLLIIRSCRTAGYSATAIRRLLHAIDRAPQSLRRSTLRAIADTPAEYETALFATFPTDTLPATLERLIALTERLKATLGDSGPEQRKPSN